MNLSSASRTLSARALGVLAVVAAIVAVFAPAASAEPVPVSYDRLGPGFNDIYTDQDAGSYVFTVNGKEVTAFCADVTKAFNGSANFTVAPADGSAVPNVAAAGWVVANAASVPTPAADADTEHAAIQVAVWSFTNNITIDDTTVPYEPVRTRAQALVAAAASNSVASGPTSFALAVSGGVQGGVARFTATLTDDAGNPIAGQPLTFTTTSGDAVTGTVETGPDGTATWEVAAGLSGAETVDVRVDWTGTLAAGSVLVPDDGSQPLILAESVEVTRTASTSVDATTPAPPAPIPTDPAPTADPVTSAPVEELPYTGGSLGLPHLVGGAALLAAAGFAVARMRRSAIA